jgi:hypothetical protein
MGGDCTQAAPQARPDSLSPQTGRGDGVRGTRIRIRACTLISFKR